MALPQRAIKACLITNPKSGRGGVDLSEPLTILHEHGWEVLVRQKLHGGHATELAQAAVRDGCNVVVDCGGDGTLNEIVEGVLGTDAAVATLPGGTANLWAHEVGISQQLGVAAMQLVVAERRRIDVGQVTVNGKHKNYFVLVAGVGLDGAIISRVNKPLKNRIGPAAVGLAALRALPSAHAVPVRIELDSLRWQGRVSQVVVGNTRLYAGITSITPEALVDDGLFDVCLITAAGPLSAGRQVGSLLLRGHPSLASSQTYRAARFTLTAAVTLPLEVDGGSVHLEDEAPTAEGTVYAFTIIAQGVTMLVPRTYSGELFTPSRQADSAASVALRPVTPQSNGDHTLKNGKHGGKHASKHTGNHHDKQSGKHDDAPHGKRKQWRINVVAVGSDSITGSRVKNGRTVQIMVDPHTVLDDGTGQPRDLWGALSSVTTGDQLRVTGHKDGASDALLASRVEHLGQNGAMAPQSDKPH
jgi:YegS/Rv2252/BmrU family lipid kinase